MVKSLAILLLLVAPALADVPPICRVSASDRSGNDYGTGTLVLEAGDVGVVYTAAHVLEGVDPATIVCTFADGRAFRGAIITVDEPHDLAALAIAPPKTLGTYPVGEYAGGEIIVGGWGAPTDSLRLVSGRFSPAQYAEPGNYGIAGCGVRNGDSGGPALSNGRVIGVLWGTSDHPPETMIHGGEVFQAFHRGVLAKLTSKRVEAKIACCPSGGCGGWSSGQCPVPYRPSPRPSQPPVTQSPPSAPAAPAVDWQAALDKQAAELVAIHAEMAALKKQTDAYKECHCDGNCDQLRSELNQKIETLAAAQVNVTQTVEQLATKSETPNYDTIAAEVAKRLTHSATVTLLDGTVKTQTRPLSEPLEFIQHSRTAK